MLVLPDRDELLFEFDLANLKPQAKESPESSGRIRLAMITTIPTLLKPNLPENNNL